MIYPANYGFVPRNYCDDLVPIDIRVHNSETLISLSVLRVCCVGPIRLTDEGKRDDTLIAVHRDDPALADYCEIAELPAHMVRRDRRLFEDYTHLEHKGGMIDALLGPGETLRILRDAIDLYDGDIAPT